MAAHGTALWGNKGNTAYFSYGAFISTPFIDFFFCCIDKFYVTSYLPKAPFLYSRIFYMMHRSLNLERIKNVRSL